MRKSSKMLSLVIALIFLFSAVTPALALSADADDAGARLKSLGIIEGYPDGSLGLDRTITRAEMAVVLAEMSGMGNAANVLKSVPSKFSDVATNVWYTGYVNLAANQGWVSGYPDGSFKPNANVTYAEAITMMLNVLGYSKGELPGTWPNNYLIKAAELGVSDDVSFATGSPALRGDVFVFANAALDEQVVTWSTDDSDWVYGDTLLEKLDLEVIEDVVLDDAYVMFGSSLDDDDREVSDGYTVAEGFDIRPYVGVETDFYVNDDDEIVGVDSSSTVSVDALDAITVSGGVYELALDNDDDDVYDISEDGVFIVNEEVVDITDLDGIAGGPVKFILNDDDEVVFIDVVDYTAMDSALVEEVEFEKEYADINAYAGTELSIDTEDDTVLLIGAASLEDIKEWDVVYSEIDGDEILLYVISDMVSGEATRYVEGDYIRIAGTNYDLGFDYYVSLDNADSWDFEGDIADFSGEDVTALLDGYGNVYAIFSDIEATADNVAYVLGEVKGNESFGDWTFKVDLFLANGTQGTYYFESDLADDILADATTQSVFEGELVEYGLNSDGELDEFTAYVPADFSLDVELNEDDMEDYSRIDGFYATSSTVFFNFSADDSDDWDLYTWDEVKAAGGSTAAAVYADSDDDIEYVIFFEAITGAGDDYAVFLDSWIVGSGSDAEVYVELATADGVVEYVYDDATSVVALDENDLVMFEMSGDKVTAMTEVTEGPKTLGSSPYDSTRSRISIDGAYYDVSADTVVIDNSGDAPVVVSASNVRRDDVVHYADVDGELMILVIVD